MKGSFNHSAKSKLLIKQKIAEAHKRAIEDRGDYLTPEGKIAVKEKMDARLTPDRRKQFAEETEEARKLAEKARKEAADTFAKQYYEMIRRMQKEGMGLREIATKMNEDGHTSRRGGAWTDQTVRQILKRIKPEQPKARDLSSEVLGNSKKVVVQNVRIETPKRIIGWDRKV